MPARVIEVEGIPLAVQSSGDGPPILLVAGMGLDHRMWSLQVPVLAASGRQVVTYDARGHGASGVPPTGYTVVDFAREAMGLLDALGIERCDILGVSMGGSIVARMAVRWPERIRSVAIIGSMPLGYPHLSDWMRQGATASMVMDGSMDLPTYRARRRDSFMYAPTLADPVAGPIAAEAMSDALQTLEVLRETTLERQAGWASPTDWDLWVETDRVVPALVMAGSLDEPTFQRFAHDAETLPRATGHIVDGAAHLANISHPDEVHRHLLAHLAAPGTAP